VDETRIDPNQRNEGEGNKTAAREYNEAQRRFVQSGAVEERAREAARAMNSAEREELERAEAIGKQRAEPSRAQILAQRARHQTQQTGDYLARNVHEYPFEALLIAGLIGYGFGFLIHRGWHGEPSNEAPSGELSSALKGHSGDVLRPLEG
jgi:ElaB/YqjD/DUF883 family membrane-anchored ribosome-binding protein